MKGTTLAAASSVDKDLKWKLKTGANIDAAKEFGKLVAERAVKAGSGTSSSTAVILWPVKALAEGAREGGLSF